MSSSNSPKSQVADNFSADEPNFLQAPIHIMVGYDHMVIGDEWTPKGAVPA